MKITREINVNDLAIQIVLPETGNPIAATKGHVEVANDGKMGVNVPITLSEDHQTRLNVLRDEILNEHKEAIMEQVYRDLATTESQPFTES